MKSNQFGQADHNNNGGKLTQGVAVTESVTQLVKPEGGWVPIGHTEDGSYVVHSQKTGMLVILRARDLNLAKLKVWFGQDVRQQSMVYDHDLKTYVEEEGSAADAIAQACDALGPIDLNQVRGPGLYRDGQELVMNFGHQLTRTDGAPVPLVGKKPKVVYQGGPSLGFDLDTPCASDEEVRRVVQVLSTFGFESEGDSMKVLGWFVSAFFGSALPHRPVLALSAERSSGKTTLMELLSNLLGPQATRRDGIPTAAQVLHAMEKSSATLLLDEVEARGGRKTAVDGLFELVRSQFTQSGSPRHYRASGGKLRHFNTPTGVAIAGISLPSFNGATETRVVQLNLAALPESSRHVYEPLLDPSRHVETVQLGARLRRLLVARWAVMRDTLSAARALLLGLGHDPRFLDKYAPIVAGYVALTRDQIPTPEELRSLIARMNLETPEEVKVERDADRCLRRVLGRKLVVFHMAHGVKEKKYLTIQETLTQIVHGSPAHRESLTRQLEALGVRPMWLKDPARWKLAIASSEQHDGMRQLMMGTDWALGGWKDVLARLPGAESGHQRIGGMTHRVVMMDMPREVLEPVKDTYDFPEPDAA